MQEIFDVWDEMHPADGGESEIEFREAGDYSDLEDVPQIPTCDLLPEHIDYSARAPGDFVIGGPLGAGRGPGRYFKSTRDAILWAKGKYGSDRVKRLEGDGSEFRWGLLIKAVA